MKPLCATAALALTLAACSDAVTPVQPTASAVVSSGGGGSPGNVYAMTNDATNN
ncbi:MAG: hypothetical protein M3466_00420 [Gemmatimonadota bacterium]|nr:hypothetical protein [Gemmatimonadota bacterium]